MKSSRAATLITALSLLTAGCATAPLDRAGSLATYDNLKTSDGVLTKSVVHVDKDDVLAAKTVRIAETRFSTAAVAGASFTEDQRRLMGNAVDRALCFGLSDRFQIVGSTDPADLVVHAVITRAAPTDPTAAGASKVVSVVPSILLPGVPVPVPRIPIGLGSLSVEAEARDPRGRQKAAIVWGRGANSFTSAGRVSTDGDAYDLAGAFGADFSKLLVTGSTPFGAGPSLPSAQSLNTALGGAPKQVACEAFGRSPGVAGMIGERIGLPPDWTDKGGAAPPAQAANQ
ncbi:DUF3313 domain-containing protein [Bradyrhizobium sp. LMTR 3]|uniref:DUF3313 domain-containing protein n=1 Tax=Bradyrhizobium sp. LMTR 3 TaxID=189873 RepID=UPI000810AA34|nr:DUF3313 domain-containing protein [Bradyrhizobium sp. LMTR 3]OCK55427.1 hypothetical protein LMTR3_11475 [Bradyrhizobium sp. LMTR 3]